MKLSLLNEANIGAFLKLGYFLKVDENRNLDIPTIKYDLEKMDFEELSHFGSNLFRNIISDKFEYGKKHLIPLSGGLDSRFILGNLLELTPAENIQTITFGIPGTFDFEIGKKISKKLGVKNFEINYNKEEFSREILRDASKRFNNQLLLFYHPNYVNLERFGNFQWWSGYLGGTIAGAHYYSENKSPEELKKNFLEKNSFVKSVELSKISDLNLIKLVEDKINYSSRITPYENIDIQNRQSKYIQPQLHPKGFNVFSPFASSKWTSFFLNIPTSYRENMKLYRAIMMKNNSTLFRLPSKSHLGVGMTSSKFEKLVNYSRLKIIEIFQLGPTIKQRHINFFNFGDKLKTDSKFRMLNLDLIQNFKQRNFLKGVDIEKIWKDHLENNRNYGDAIQVLSSLEIIFQNLNEDNS